MLDGMRHHWAVLRAAWSAESATPCRASPGVEERAFLPAVLEITESPPAPHGRTMAYLIMGFFAVTLLWAVFGQVEIHAVTQGKVIPSGRVKVIQPLEAGVVKKILVSDGELVTQGAPLVELDPTDSNADATRLEQEWMEAEAEAVRLHTLSLAGVDQPLASLVKLSGVSDQVLQRHERMATAQWRLFQATLTTIDQEMAQKRAELKTIRGEIAKLQEQLPLVAKRVAARKKLAESGNGSWLTYYETEEARVNVSGEIRNQQNRLEQGEVALAALQESRHRTEAEFRQDLLNRLLEAEKRKGSLRQELDKAKNRQNRQVLTAPVAGLVQQLSIHTLGGVVTPAQNLLVIVPTGQEVEIEVMVLNKDIGFVRVGQNAAVKVDSFPFTKYGTIAGTVLHVSNDAIDNEKLGLVFPSRVRLARAAIVVDGKEVPLTPGMAVEADITTGQRRLIEYLLAPLMQLQAESFRER